MRPRWSGMLSWVMAAFAVAGGSLAAGSSGAAAPSGSPPPAPGAGMAVTGILGGTSPVAIIRVEGQTVIAGVGERVGDAVVVAIRPSEVVLKRGSVTFAVPGPSAAVGRPLVLAVAPPGGTPPLPPGAGMIVTGILGGPAPVAIIRTGGQTVIAAVGERVGDAVVVSILAHKVVLRQGSVTFEVPGPSAAVGPPLVLGAGPPGATPESSGAGLAVTGILGGRARVAIIRVEGQTVIAGVGEHAGDAVVVSILADRVVLRRNGATFELPIGATH